MQTLLYSPASSTPFSPLPLPLRTSSPPPSQLVGPSPSSPAGGDTGATPPQHFLPVAAHLFTPATNQPVETVEAASPAGGHSLAAPSSDASDHAPSAHVGSPISSDAGADNTALPTYPSTNDGGPPLANVAAHEPDSTQNTSTSQSTTAGFFTTSPPLSPGAERMNPPANLPATGSTFGTSAVRASSASVSARSLSPTSPLMSASMSSAFSSSSFSSSLSSSSSTPSASSATSPSSSSPASTSSASVIPSSYRKGRSLHQLNGPSAAAYFDSAMADDSLDAKPSGQERFKADTHAIGVIGRESSPARSHPLIPLDHPASAASVPVVVTAEYFPTILTDEAEQELTFEIMDLIQSSLTPSQEALARRRKFIAKINYILSKQWPDKDIKVHPFGSTVNGLGTSSSDVDLCLTTTWDDPVNGISNMHVVAACLRSHGMTKISTVTKAKVPICKFFDPEFRISCDINVNNTIALRNTTLIRLYVELDPRVRPIILIIKHWAKQRVLNDAAKGGTLSSYCWVIMVLNFLQTRDPPIIPSLHQLYFDHFSSKSEAPRPKPIVIDGVDCSFEENIEPLKSFGSKNHETLGGLVYSFFRLFAYEFDYDSSVLSVRHGRVLTKAEKQWDLDVDKMCRHLCVEEPFTPDRNLANSADAVSVNGLKKEFRRALEVLGETASIEAACEPFFAPQPPHAHLASPSLHPRQNGNGSARGTSPARHLHPLHHHNSNSHTASSTNHGNFNNPNQHQHPTSAHHNNSTPSTHSSHRSSAWSNGASRSLSSSQLPSLSVQASVSYSPKFPTTSRQRNASPSISSTRSDSPNRTTARIPRQHQQHHAPSSWNQASPSASPALGPPMSSPMFQTTDGITTAPPVIVLPMPFAAAYDPTMTAATMAGSMSPYLSPVVAASTPPYHLFFAAAPTGATGVVQGMSAAAYVPALTLDAQSGYDPNGSSLVHGTQGPQIAEAGLGVVVNSAGGSKGDHGANVSGEEDIDGDSDRTARDDQDATPSSPPKAAALVTMSAGASVHHRGTRQDDQVAIDEGESAEKKSTPNPTTNTVYLYGGWGGHVGASAPPSTESHDSLKDSSSAHSQNVASNQESSSTDPLAPTTGLVTAASPAYATYARYIPLVHPDLSVRYYYSAPSYIYPHPAYYSVAGTSSSANMAGFPVDESSVYYAARRDSRTGPDGASSNGNGGWEDRPDRRRTGNREASSTRNGQLPRDSSWDPSRRYNGSVGGSGGGGRVSPAISSVSVTATGLASGNPQARRSSSAFPPAHRGPRSPPSSGGSAESVQYHHPSQGFHPQPLQVKLIQRQWGAGAAGSNGGAGAGGSRSASPVTPVSPVMHEFPATGSFAETHRPRNGSLSSSSLSSSSSSSSYSLSSSYALPTSGGGGEDLATSRRPKQQQWYGDSSAQPPPPPPPPSMFASLSSSPSLPSPSGGGWKREHQRDRAGSGSGGVGWGAAPGGSSFSTDEFGDFHHPQHSQQRQGRRGAPWGRPDHLSREQRGASPVSPRTPANGNGASAGVGGVGGIGIYGYGYGYGYVYSYGTGMSDTSTTLPSHGGENQAAPSPSRTQYPAGHHSNHQYPQNVHPQQQHLHSTATSTSLSPLSTSLASSFYLARTPSPGPATAVAHGASRHSSSPPTAADQHNRNAHHHHHHQQQQQLHNPSNPPFNVPHNAHQSQNNNQHHHHHQHQQHNHHSHLQQANHHRNSPPPGSPVQQQQQQQQHHHPPSQDQGRRTPAVGGAALSLSSSSSGKALGGAASLTAAAAAAAQTPQTPTPTPAPPASPSLIRTGRSFIAGNNSGGGGGVGVGSGGSGGSAGTSGGGGNSVVVVAVAERAAPFDDGQVSPLEPTPAPPPMKAAAVVVVGSGAPQ